MMILEFDIPGRVKDELEGKPRGEELQRIREHENLRIKVGLKTEGEVVSSETRQSANTFTY